MKLSRRSALCIALFAGSLAALTMYIYVGRAARGNTASASQHIEVVKAAADIAPQSIIKAHQIKTEVRRAKGAPRHAVTGIENAIGRVALVGLPKGQIIEADQIAEPSPALGLAHAVPQHMRAITVGLDSISGVAGFLKPGNHVDVLATVSEDDITVTLTVLQDVELLALGQEAQPTPEDRPDASGKPARVETQPTATVAVTPEQAQRLVLAESKGKLRLALRSVEDHNALELAKTTDWEVTGIQPKSTESTVASRHTPGQQPYPGMYPPWWYDHPGAAAPGGGEADDLDELIDLPKSIEVIRGTDREVVDVNE
ncbi:MAG: Flp pilus assembly protein CpaB [Armatimonadota bacterium]